MTGRRTLIATYGTRGDVDPFLALALGLRAAGHDVSFATAARFAERVGRFGLPFLPITNASLDLIDTPDGRAMLEGTGGFLRRIGAVVRLSRRSGDINRAMIRDTWAAANAVDPELVIYHPKVMAAPHIAEKLRVPAMLGLLQPIVVPTGAFPAVGLPRLPLPGWNRASYRLVGASYGAFRKVVNAYRVETLGLPPVRKGIEVLLPSGAGTIPVLHGVSPLVIPRPEDWPPHAVMTGTWRLPTDPGYVPSPELAAFLDAGPAPVYVGFGSMTSGDRQALARLVTEAVKMAGVRAVVSTGWAKLEIDAREDVIAIADVPHGWLFPRMAAVVHHGGAGTTAEGFQAGVPCVICPFIGDQPGWARRSVELGVGAPPVPRGRLTADRLAYSIRIAVTDPKLRENAAALGEKLRSEDGVANAVRVIEGRLADGGRGS